jgi:hypothetical protein
VDRLWPVARVEQLLAYALREVSDGSLGDAILVVGVFPTKGELLPCIMACLLEAIVVKAPIAPVIVRILTPCLAAYCSKASLAVSVSADPSSIWRWTNRRRLKWWTKTVADL